MTKYFVIGTSYLVLHRKLLYFALSTSYFGESRNFGESRYGYGGDARDRKPEGRRQEFEKSGMSVNGSLPGVGDLFRKSDDSFLAADDSLFRANDSFLGADDLLRGVDGSLAEWTAYSLERMTYSLERTTRSFTKTAFLAQKQRLAIRH